MQDRFTAIVKENMALDPEWNKLARLSATPFTGASVVEDSEYRDTTEDDDEPRAVRPDAIVMFADGNVSVQINPHAIDPEEVSARLRDCADHIDAQGDGE